MVELKASAGYDLGGGKMGTDTLLKNTESYSIVVYMSFWSYDATPKLLGAISVCIPPFGTSQCFNVRGNGLILSDPYKVYVYRCISSPNCANNSCATFSTIADSSIYGEVKQWNGQTPSSPLYTVPSDCAPCTQDWQCESPLNGYEYDRCTQTRRQAERCNPISVRTNTRISVGTITTSPFKAGDKIIFGGIIEEDTLSGCDIPSGSALCPTTSGVPIRIQIKVSGTTLVNQSVTSFVQTSLYAYNYKYEWTVPSGYEGSNVEVSAFFEGSAGYNPSSATKTYSIEKPVITCDLSLNPPPTQATIGQQMTFSGSLSCGGIGLSGKVVEIWDSLGFDEKIATATTGNDGLFSAPWTIKDINYYPNSGVVEVYAKYSETGIVSQKYKITLSSVPTPDIRYSCNFGTCQQTVNGQYATLIECQNACKDITQPTDKYVCINGTCQKDNIFGTRTLEQCQSICTSQPLPGGVKYNCINNICTPDPSGVYPIEECQSTCRPPESCPSGYYKDNDGKCKKYIQTPFGNIKEEEAILGGIIGIVTGIIILKELTQ